MKNTKYTHITERCSSILRDFASSRIEQQTGQPVSRAYWRLRDGLGLLTISDSETLGMWCDLITHVRKYTGSPVSLYSNFRDKLKDKRDALIDKMEEYRSWLTFGSMPTYFYDNFENTAVAKILLEYALSGILCGKSGMSAYEIPAEELKGWLDKIDTNDLIGIARHFYPQFNINLAEYQLREYIKTNGAWNTGFHELEADKAWQIRTDMEHRSSIGAKINERLLWFDRIKDKSTDHKDSIMQNLATIKVHRIWKEKEKQRLKISKETNSAYKGDPEDAFNRITDVLNGIVIPPFTPIKKDK